MRSLFLATLILFTACNTTGEPLRYGTSADTLVVGNKDENSVSFIDLDNGTEVARIATGAMPHEVAASPDRETVAVVHYGASAVELFAVDAPASLRTIALGDNAAPHGIAWTRDDRLVITTERSGTLSIVDLADDSVAAIPTGQEVSHMVALSPDEATAFVSNMGSGTVSVIDLERGETRRDIAVGETPEGLAVSPDGRTLWVADRARDTLIAYEIGSYREVRRYATGGFPIRVAVSPDGRRVLTSDYADGALTLIEDGDAPRSIPVSGSRKAGQVTILFAEDSRHVFVAETGRATVALVDLDTGKVVRRFNAGAGADGLALAD
ncbi:YncE family protein [Sphingomicrobium astaxanthinifaciens]|uniref:YncE family protein n=1 Tax=Sphingomicrobium astaxanthinifaciens TaxID=1227949 RepID=UPI001FCACC2A|nr:YncE family protein [Sphingomicrobium astaxanthinifaciens]MCJ7420889.1 YncE family protein [Sphingomicrobium astaxanthinifaciens]